MRTVAEAEDTDREIVAAAAAASRTVDRIISPPNVFPLVPQRATLVPVFGWCPSLSLSSGAPMPDLLPPSPPKLMHNMGHGRSNHLAVLVLLGDWTAKWECWSDLILLI